MSSKTYPVPKSASTRAKIDAAKYDKWYKESVEEPEIFWDRHGRRIDWFKPYTKVKNTSFKGRVSIKWFEDGQTNVSYNCIDRHLKTRGEETAIIWEGDNPYIDKKITYNQLYDQVCRMANVMKKHGVKKKKLQWYKNAKGMTAVQKKKMLANVKRGLTRAKNDGYQVIYIDETVFTRTTVRSMRTSAVFVNGDGALTVAGGSGRPGSREQCSSHSTCDPFARWPQTG